MPRYEDECLSIELPEDWKVLPNEGGCFIDVGQFKAEHGPIGIKIGICPDDPDMSPRKKCEGFAEAMAKDPYSDPPLFDAEVVDPFHCGPHVGARVDKSFHDGFHTFGSYAGMIVDGYYVYIHVLGIAQKDVDLVWKSMETLRVKEDATEVLQTRELALQAEFDAASIEAEPIRLVATDLSKPRTKRFIEWMDHQMVLLMDSESYPEDNPFVDSEEVYFVMPCNDKALWLVSVTEFDVTLEFVVRSDESKPHKEWWNREAEGMLSIPTGHLHVEQTTGGLLMDIELEPGDYKAIVKGFSPEGSDAGDEGVEKIQVTLVPVA